MVTIGDLIEGFKKAYELLQQLFELLKPLFEKKDENEDPTQNA